MKKFFVEFEKIETFRAEIEIEAATYQEAVEIAHKYNTYEIEMSANMWEDWDTENNIIGYSCEDVCDSCDVTDCELWCGHKDDMQYKLFEGGE
jgi:hypothetical protein